MIISRFQNINPKKEGKTVNGLADVKSELRMIIVEDEHFSIWKEFIERHHWGKLINPDSGEMFKEKDRLPCPPNSSSLVSFLSTLATSPILTSRCMFSISWGVHLDDFPQSQR